MIAAKSKPWYRSKTQWAAMLTTLVGVLGLLAGEAWIQEYPRVVAGIVTMIGVANFVLRLITRVPIATMKVLLVACLLLSGSIAGAADVVVLRYSDPGRYYVQIDVDASGSARVESLTATELTLGDSITPGEPFDPDVPKIPPTKFIGIGKIAFDESGKLNDPATAGKLAGVYQQVHHQLSTGKIESGETAMEILRTMTDLVLTARGKSDEWANWRLAIGAELTSQAQAGTLDYEMALLDVAHGLLGNVKPNEAIDIRTIIKLVGIVVEAKKRGELLSMETLLLIVAAIGGL